MLPPSPMASPGTSSTWRSCWACCCAREAEAGSRWRSVRTPTLDYRDGAATLKGVIIDDDRRAGQRPGIVLFPDARGIGDHAIACAERLAALGLVVLVADLYGDGA